MRSPLEILIFVTWCLRPNSSDKTKPKQVGLAPSVSMDPLMRLENALLAWGFDRGVCKARKARIFPLARAGFSPFGKSCASPLVPTNVLFPINVQCQPEDWCVEPQEGNHFTSVVRNQLGHCVYI